MNQRPPGLKEAMRNVPSTVALVTSRDEEGRPHGMAASAVISVSVEPPSMLLSVNRTAGLHPVVQASGKLCINFLAQQQEHLLLPFSRSELRAQRFMSHDWQDTAPEAARLPWLPHARAVVFGAVDQAVPYGTHTLFIVRVHEVILPEQDAAAHAPLVWLGGRSACLAPQPL
ncbi:flavin reductase family protein [Bordetella genomosp. 12]|uniref:Flavin reductase like domain-containing protein n=1 Tax=Bordetella genomosp. 12 TaxID=463035 RepID=A0A261VK80_9BORD|nr:flavin reductase family protein [Bordetella genomosp. 12]OZI74247.1 hypothetical protein CAL22_07030 [Bordetella genomosp. 12]